MERRSQNFFQRASSWGGKAVGGDSHQRSTKDGQNRDRARRQTVTLGPDTEPTDIDDLFGQARICLACHE